MRNESKIIFFVCIALITLNLASLLSTIKLLDCHEVVRYQDDGGIKSFSLRNFSFVLLFNAMLNIVFVLAALLARLVSK